MEEYRSYMRHLENLRYQRSALGTSYDDGVQEGRREGRREGLEEGTRKVALNLLSLRVPVATIVQATGLTEEEINGLRSE